MKGFKNNILLSFLFGSMLISLNGCSFAFTTNYIYQNGEKYVAGDREITDKIENIDIDYMSGDVKLIASETNTVSIKETSKKQLDDKRKVHTWVDGNTLYVRYCESSKKLDLNNLEKNLEITIPKDVKLTDTKIKASSGNVTCKGFEADKVNVYVSSGDISADFDTKDIKMHASSGDITLNQTGDSDDISVDTSSGDINATMQDVTYLTSSASSGNITLSANKINDFSSRTSSGINEFHFAETPENTNIHSSSGKVTIYLPENADLTADLDSSADDVYFDLPFEKTSDSFICGNGSNKMKVHTSSGDIYIKKN